MATETKNSGSGTWTVPSGNVCTLIEGWGAGGGGGTGGGGPGEAGSGGGGGGYFSYTPGAPISAGTNISYSVGTGGAGDDARDGEDGIAGGATTVSTYSLTANGGGKGLGLNSGGASGGTASGGTTNTTGGTSSNPGGGTGTAGGAGANGGAGGAGGGSSSPAGQNGTAPGGGGGGGGRNTAAGDGAAGRIVFTYSASGTTYNETGSGGCVGGGSATVLKGSLFSNLSAFWKLEETSGTRLDETENNNDLTDTNSVSYSSAKVGNGATFVSSSNQHLSIADNSTINLGSTDFSISFWVNFSALTNNGANDYIGVMSKGSGGASYAFSIQYRPSNSQLQIQFYNGGTTYTLWASSFGSFSTSTWYHVIATYTNSSKATTLSVNGTQNSGTASIAVVDSSYGLSLGRGYYSNTYNSSCTIDAVGLWKRVLTTSEKAKLYRLGHGNEYPFENSFTETIEGGAVAGSSAIVSLSQTMSADGGIVCSGTASTAEAETFVPDGGAEIGGSAVISHDVYPLGGIVCDGSATVELIRKGLEISGKSFWHVQLPCSGEISIQNSYFAGLIQNVFRNMGENFEVHIFDDLSLPDEITSESDWNTWEMFVKEPEEFSATASETEIVLDAGLSPYFEFDEGETKVITGWAVVGETSRIVYWGNFHGVRTISNSNTSEFFVRLKFRRGI